MRGRGPRCLPWRWAGKWPEPSAGLAQPLDFFGAAFDGGSGQAIQRLRAPAAPGGAPVRDGVLAYRLVQVIQTGLPEGGEQASWTTLRGRLAGQHRVTTVTRRADGRTLIVCKATQAEAGQQAIYDALGVSASPGRVRKIIVEAADRGRNSPNVVRDARFRTGNQLTD